MNNIEKVLTAIIDGDCKILIAYLSEKEIKENRIETNLDDYNCIGEYETDARYVYPSREHLIITVLRKLLKENNECKLTALSFLRKLNKEIER